MKSPGLLTGYGYQEEENKPTVVNSSKKKQMTPKHRSNKDKKGEKRSLDEELNTVKSEPKEKTEKNRAIGDDISTQHIRMTPVEKKPRLSGPSPFGKKNFCGRSANQSQQSFGLGKQWRPKGNEKQFNTDKPAWKKKKGQFLNKPNNAPAMKDLEKIIAIQKKRRNDMENCALVVKHGGLDVDGWKKLHSDIVTARASKKNKMVWLSFPSESARNKAYKTIASNKSKSDEMVVDYCGEKSKNMKNEFQEDIDSAAINSKMLKIFGVPYSATMEDLLALFPKAACIKIKTDFIKNSPNVVVEFVRDAAAHEAFLRADNLKIQGAQIFVLYALFYGSTHSLKNDVYDESHDQKVANGHLEEMSPKEKKSKGSQGLKEGVKFESTVKKMGFAEEEEDEDDSEEDGEDDGEEESDSEDEAAANKIDDSVSSFDNRARQTGQGGSDSDSSEESSNE